MADLVVWTRDQFEEFYNHGEIHYILSKHGGIVVPCRNCDGGEECHGWKMSRLHRKEDDLELYGVTEEEWAEAESHRLEVIRGE